MTDIAIVMPTFKSTLNRFGQPDLGRTSNCPTGWEAARKMRQPTLRWAWLPKAIIAVAVTVLSPRPSCALQPEQTLSIDGCISIALANHPAIKASQAGYCGAVDQSSVAKSYLKPDIRADVNYTTLNEPVTVDVDVFGGPLGDRLIEAASFFEIARQAGGAAAVAALDDLNGPAFTQTKQALAGQIPTDVTVGLLGRNSVTSQVQLIQPLWTHGKLTSRVQQSQVGVEIAQAEIHKTENEIAFNVAHAYLTILFCDELRNTASTASGYAKGVEALAQGLVDQGDEYVSMADVLRARTFRSLYEEQVVGFRSSRERALTALKLAMGLPQKSPVEIADVVLPTDRVDTNLEILKQQALANRPELRQANLALRVAYLEKKIAHADYFPNVAAFASFTNITDDANYPNPTNPNQLAAGVTATMPIYSGGRRHAKERQAMHIECQVTEQRQLVARVVEQQVEDAYLELREMTGRMKQATAAVTSATDTLDAFQAQFNVGLIAPAATSKYYEDLLTTRLLLVTAHARYFQALYDYNVALAKLKLAIAEDPRAGFMLGAKVETAKSACSGIEHFGGEFIR